MAAGKNGGRTEELHKWEVFFYCGFFLLQKSENCLKKQKHPQILPQSGKKKGKTQKKMCWVPRPLQAVGTEKQSTSYRQRGGGGGDLSTNKANDTSAATVTAVSTDPVKAGQWSLFCQQRKVYVFICCVVLCCIQFFFTDPGGVFPRASQSPPGEVSD